MTPGASLLNLPTDQPWTLQEANYIDPFFHVARLLFSVSKPVPSEQASRSQCFGVSYGINTPLRAVTKWEAYADTFDSCS